MNYHHKLCIHIQEILPKLCDFHNDDTFRDDTKNVLFESILLSLHTLYPKLQSNNFTSFQVPIHESWPQTMQKLRTITQMEIRKNSTGRNKVAQLSSDKFSQNFIKMTALIWYIVRTKCSRLCHICTIQASISCRCCGIWSRITPTPRRHPANVPGSTNWRA